MQVTTYPGSARSLLRRDLPPGTIGLAWLGQSGFLVRSSRRVLLIDPYLSDSLAKKYQGKEFPHLRLQPPPIEPTELRGVDVVLCTHRHGDHMDPGTLPAIVEANEDCRFIVPRAEQESAKNAGLPKERLIGMNAGEVISLFADVHVCAIASAHEMLKTNDRGEHYFLGYVLRLAGLTLYHSGDCVPYEGLAEQLRREQVDLAMLPINGRDQYRRSRGVPGNMTIDEAVELCSNAHIPWLVPHHFGMFAFNTLGSESLADGIARLAGRLQITTPRLDTWFALRDTDPQHTQTGVPGFAQAGWVQ